MSVEPTGIVQNLTPYTPGEQPQEGGFIKLNTNENPYPPSPEVLDAIRKIPPEKYRLYPDPVCGKIRTLLAQKHAVSKDQIFIGNGSDEVLRLLFQAFLSRGETLAITDPSYSLYPVLAQTLGAKVRTFPLGVQGELPVAPDFSGIKVCAVANPNPPLGISYSYDELESLVSSHDSVLFIIDEAYVDFAERNALELIRHYKNTVITRSLSKSYSLAGIRVGYALGNQALVQNLYKIKDSYNVNHLSQAAALAAFRSEDYYHDTILKIKQDRDFLTRELRNLGFKVYDSSGNFVFAQSGDGKSLYNKLKQEKILVRYFDTPRLRRGVRITIGTHEEILALLKVLQKT